MQIIFKNNYFMLLVYKKCVIGNNKLSHPYLIILYRTTYMVAYDMYIYSINVLFDKFNGI